VDGHMLADVSGEEVEKWLIQNEYARKSEVAADAHSRSARAEPPPKTTSLGKARLPGKTSKSRFFD